LGDAVRDGDGSQLLFSTAEKNAVHLLHPSVGRTLALLQAAAAAVVHKQGEIVQKLAFAFFYFIFSLLYSTMINRKSSIGNTSLMLWQILFHL
jgi:hypothetical protein